LGSGKIDCNIGSKICGKSFIYFILLAGIGSIWLLLHSLSTTPLVDGYYGFDVIMFRVFGEGWSRGMIPYRDLFDHKGPVFHLFYMLGYRISDSKWSMFIIQCVIFSITLGSFYKIARLFVREKLAFIFVLMTLLVMNRCLDWGGMTEEFSLPFLCVSLYFQLLWFKKCQEAQRAGKKICRHPWQWAFIYGVSFMCIAFIRLNNAFALCFFVLVIAIRLAVNSEYRNLLQNAGGFLLGMLLVFLPVSIYFIANHAFYDMIYSVFLFNLKYMELTAQTYSISQWVYVLVYLLPLLILFAVSILYGFRCDRWLGTACALCCVFSFRLLTTGSILAHYYVLCIPYFPIALGMFKEIISIKNRLFTERVLAWGILLVILVFCVISVYASVRHYERFAAIRDHDTTAEFYESARRISEEIPPDERDRVMGYNFSCVDASWYLVTDIMPCYRYFGLTEWFAKIDPAIGEENASFLKSGRAKWVVTMRGEFEDEAIKAILADKYYLYKTEHLDTSDRDIDLYRLKQPG